jgi:hypothetical protein
LGQFVIHTLDDDAMYAIITFRHQGPLKNWQAIRAANVHNARTKPLAHAMPDAPAPKHLIGIGDLERDVKRLLRVVKLDPDQLRKNGVIAYEAILSASPAFFEQGSPDEQAKRLTEWTAAQVTWAKERYQSYRIASMVLHTDEKTPHIHLVVLPLEVKSDKRWSDKTAMRWKLVGRTISGPGRFDEAQDAYAAAMAPFGLIRGVKGSGRKHEPVPVYLARLAAKERDVDDARETVRQDAVAVAADQHRIMRDRDALVIGFDRLAQSAAATAEDRRKLDDERDALEKARAAHAARVADDERRLAADRAAVRQQLADLRAMEDELQQDMASQKAEAAATTRAMQAATTLSQEAEADRIAAADERSRAEAMAAKIEQHRAQLLPTFRAAAEFRKRVDAVRGQPLTPAASATRAAVDALRAAASTVSPPSQDMRPDVHAAYANIRRQAGGLGG